MSQLLVYVADCFNPSSPFKPNVAALEDPEKRQA